MKKSKINVCNFIDFILWLLVAYWICCLLFFYGCRSSKTVEESFEKNSLAVRDTIVKIPIAYDTFTVSTSLRDTVIFSSRLFSDASIKIESGKEFAKIIYRADTVLVKIDSAIQINEKTKLIRETKTVYKCQNKFHYFAEWFTVIAVLLIILFITLRALPFILK